MQCKYNLPKLFLAVLIVFFVTGVRFQKPSLAVLVTGSALDPSGGLKVLEAYGKLPLSFEANQGQTDGRAKFLSRGSGYTLFLTPKGAVLSLSQPDAHAVLRMQLLGANPDPLMVGLDELPSKVNYFIGNDPKTWRTGIPTYTRVRYEDVYPGVNLVYYGNQGQLEYDLVVASGADPKAIRLRFEGADKISLDDQGNLIVHIAGGEVIQHAPVIYQEVGGARREISGGYALQGEGRVGFQVAAYDVGSPLVIDPVLEYASYLGGSDSDEGNGIAVGADGSIYVTGQTSSDDFPTANAAQGSRGGNIEAFVTRLSADGSSLVYSTYLGGDNDDVAEAIAVDAQGNAYVTGRTSDDFPTTTGSFNETRRGPRDAFVVKLDPNGSALLYSGLLAGGRSEEAYGIAVDGDGNAYVAGKTDSDDFPTTPGSFDPTFNGNTDAFVTKLNAAGSALVYSTYLGGSGEASSGTDGGIGVAVDGTGNAYVTGWTGSEDFPTTPGAFQTALAAPGYDVFVTKMSTDGSALVYSTFLGSTRFDMGFGIAVDAAGHAYVTGAVGFDDFPTTANAFQTSRGGSAGDTDAFVTKLNASGSALDCSSFLGGSGVEKATGIAVDAAANAYLTGWTASVNFPIARPISGGSENQDGDVYVTKVATVGCDIVYSSFLGGSGRDRNGGDAGDPDGNLIAADAEGCAYVTGRTRSTDFPTTSGAFQAAFGGGVNDAFVAKICPGLFVYLPLVVK